MAETWDYEKLGQITWRATVALDDGQEPWAETVRSCEFRGARSKGLAKAYINRTLVGLHSDGRDALLAHPDGYYWGRIERGTYHDTSFIDPDRYGLVLDATWEPDEHQGELVGGYAYLQSSGVVSWDETP